MKFCANTVKTKFILKLHKHENEEHENNNTVHVCTATVMYKTNVIVRH